ncbi:hypothetical protein [Allocoleopsis sp.]|uniref:hypothetical protein n=1 Tax=Allocoleopsis sp. TaxID=3088169 RepID=UPI002FD5485E
MPTLDIDIACLVSSRRMERDKQATTEATTAQLQSSVAQAGSSADHGFRAASPESW